MNSRSLAALGGKLASRPCSATQVCATDQVLNSGCAPISSRRDCKYAESPVKLPCRLARARSEIGIACAFEPQTVHKARDTEEA